MQIRFYDKILNFIGFLQYFFLNTELTEDFFTGAQFWWISSWNMQNLVLVSLLHATMIIYVRNSY